MSAMPLKNEVEYPTSDGQPMAETTLHRIVMSDLIAALERRYAGVADVWVGGNLFLYYEKGRPEKSVSPDVLLARGVGKWNRDVYLLWDERPPSLIFEVTSRSTLSEDTRRKKDLYERIGVAELVLFDPYGEYLKPRLQGYRLQRERYRPISPGTDGSLDLATVGLTASPEGERLRLVDPAAGERLLWNEELEGERLVEAAARRIAERRAVEEGAARQAAEEHAAEEQAARRLAEERAAAAEDRVRAAEEHARALAEELARLRGEAKA